MSQKPNKKSTGGKKNQAMNRATNFFLAGCVAECYLLLVRRYYVYGKLDQVVAWDGILAVLPWIGAVILAIGAVLAILWRKTPGWKRTASWIAAGAGAFLAVTAWMIKTYYVTALTPLCVIVPVVMLLAVLWGLYDRECAYALAILGMTILVLWVCRKGVGTAVWGTRVTVGAVIYLALMVLLILMARTADRKEGMVGKLRFLPANADPLPVYVACGLSLATVAVSLLSATVAYYAMWTAAIAIFALAVYYTVKQL